MTTICASMTESGTLLVLSVCSATVVKMVKRISISIVPTRRAWDSTFCAERSSLLVRDCFSRETVRVPHRCRAVLCAEDAGMAAAACSVLLMCGGSMLGCGICAARLELDSCIGDTAWGWTVVYLQLKYVLGMYIRVVLTKGRLEHGGRYSKGNTQQKALSVSALYI